MRENERDLGLEESIVGTLKGLGETTASNILDFANGTASYECYTLQQVKKSLAHLMIKGIVVATWNKGLFYSIYKEKETEE